MVLLRVRECAALAEGRVFQDDDIVVPSASS